MRVTRLAPALEIWAPAKVNLFLEILGKRSDGYHELETLIVPISLYDTLVCEPEPSGDLCLSLEPGSRGAAETTPGSDAAPAERVPLGSDNLIVRALDKLRTRYGLRNGMRVRLHKRIPLAAGLAGGSTDAAAALWAGNLLWGLNLSRAELQLLAAELGSDVPLFLGEGAALCTGRGEHWTAVEGLASLHLIILCPPEGLSTAAVYRACRPASDLRGAGPLIEALRHGDLGLAGARLHNQLQPAAAGLSPWIDRLADRCRRLPIPGHVMSGSGSSYVALCQGALQARQLAARLRAERLGQVFHVRSSA